MSFHLLSGFVGGSAALRVLQGPRSSRGMLARVLCKLLVSPGQPPQGGFYGKNGLLSV